MIRRFFSWYLATPAACRRFVVAALVPTMEYLYLEPCRKALNVISKSNPHLAVDLSPVLILLPAVLMVATIGLFVYESFAGIGSKLKSKPAGYAFLLFVFGWVLLPIHFIMVFGDK